MNAQTQNKPQKKRGASDAKRRERLLRERRMQRFRRRLYASLTALGVLIVILVVALVKLQSSDAPMRAPLVLDAPTATPTLEPTPTAAPTATPEPTAAPTPEATPTAAPATAVPVAAEAVPVATDERVQPAVAYDPSAPFSYEAAYAAAVLGADTGAPVVPDYAGIDPAKRDRWPAADEGFMPMVSHANTDEKIIAVTVDDCFQADNLRQIVACALENGAQLTIFPIGENLQKDAVAEVVRAAWQYGMEIENHTLTHKGTYHYSDEDMTNDIWRQSYLLNQVLGVNYKQHFFRPKGGDERFDQRTHAYVRQLGFSAIALWSQSGSVDPMDSLLENLAPGRIYLFHTTDKDLTKLLQFIPAAVQRGYRLVTLNEMFGLPANETADISTAPTEKPALQSFRVIPMTLKMTAYARAAAVVQERLIELGWMHGEATGVYGKTTHACMELFQAAAGLAIDGTAGADSQRLLFSDSAPTASVARIQELAQQLDADAQSALKEMLSEYP